MPRRIRNAKRANKPNPREDRNLNQLPDFIREPRKPREHQQPEQSYEDRKFKRVELLPRNLAQETYIDHLTDPSKHVVFSIGPAGCGKTLLATEFAIKGMQEGIFKKIVITRPAVSVDEQHGFLPGDLVAKMQPWMMPILDVFKKYYSVKAVANMIANEVIEIAPLAFMRGRTFTDSIIIADEMQNSTISQMKMVLTRIGDNSRIVVTGDLRQHDRGFEANGMKDFIERLKFSRSQAMALVEFDVRDVERHPVIEDILKMYGETD